MLTEDKEFPTRSYIKDSLAVLLGGRAAEELIFNEITTGAQSDIKQATTWARRMVTDFGMSEKLGPRTFGDKQELIFLGREISSQRDYSERTALSIDKEVDSIIQNALNAAKTILLENKPKLIQIAQKLIVEETLEGEDLEALFREPVDSAPPETPPVPTPAPVEPVVEKPEPTRKARSPIIPGPLPKQSPATPD